MEHLLEIDVIRCGYEDHTVVDGLSLGLRPGSMACLLGPSGVGLAGAAALGARSARLVVSGVRGS